MAVYQINDEVLKKFWRKFLVFYAPYNLFYSTIVLAPILMMMARTEPIDWPFPTVFSLIFFWLTMFIAFRKSRTNLKFYRLEVTVARVFQGLNDTLPISIEGDEIKEIIQLQNGSFIVVGPARIGEIFIPKAVNNFDVLQQQLAAFSPITTDKKDPLHERRRKIILLLAFVLYLCLCIFTNRILVASTAVLLVVLMGGAFLQVRLSKTSLLIERGASKFYIFILISTLIVALYKLFP